MLRVPSGCLCCGGALDGLLAAGRQGSAWLAARG